MQKFSHPVRLGSLALTVLIAMSTNVAAQDSSEFTDCDSCEEVVDIVAVSEPFEGTVEEGSYEVYPSLALEVEPSFAPEVEPTVYDDGAELVLASSATAPVAMPAVMISTDRDDSQFVPTAIEGNLCLNKQTYVSFLCAWQGFERP